MRAVTGSGGTGWAGELLPKPASALPLIALLTKAVQKLTARVVSLEAVTAA